LRYLPAWIERRKSIAARYQTSLSDIKGLVLPHYSKQGYDHVYQNYTVLAEAGSAFSDHMKGNGVEILTQFRKPYYRHDGRRLRDTGFPVTERISREVCSLPMCVEIDDDEVDYVIATV